MVNFSFDTKIISDGLIILLEAVILVVQTLFIAIWEGMQAAIWSTVSNSFGGNFWVILTVLTMIFCTYVFVTRY